MPKKSKVLVLVVAYNAEKTIEKLLARFPQKILEDISQILIADDASTDNTSILVENYKIRNKIEKIKIVKHNKNKGYGGNQKWGYDYAIKNNYDIVVMIHGDAQYPPEHISDLIQPIINGRADFVFGSRISGHPLKGGMPLYKFMGNKFLTTLENLILRTKLSEFHSGFRAYLVKTLEKIPFNMNSNDFHFDSEIIFQLVLLKKKIKEIPIPTFYGDEKCHVNSFNYGLNILKSLSQYILHILKIKKYEKYNIL